MIALPGALVAAFCALPQHSLAPWHTAPRSYHGNESNFDSSTNYNSHFLKQQNNQT